jgi:HEPN domain-containing protein/predicted nucleotidyltransferase
MFGSELVGMVAYGSWARDEQATGSDVDLLVIVAEEVPITRELYRQWDENGPIQWNGHVVEPHFAQLPQADARITSLWAEVVVDGVVVLDRKLRISRRLVVIRRRILLGDVVRRWAYGQPYWVEAAEVRNQDLARDYIRRPEIRLKAIDVLFDGGSWADVVRESQEIVELALKALLRAAGIDPPRVHDVSGFLLSERSQLPDALGPEIEMLAEASRQLRRDRELAFYGAEDLTPSGFYSRADAEAARASARRTVELVKPHIPRAAHASSRTARKRRRT